MTYDDAVMLLRAAWEAGHKSVYVDQQVFIAYADGCVAIERMPQGIGWPHLDLPVRPPMSMKELLTVMKPPVLLFKSMEVHCKAEPTHPISPVKIVL